MNEKIKQLAEQASGTPSYSSDGFLPKYLFEEEELAKFAELIINECADYANWYQANSRYTDISKAIKDHFSIK